VYNNSKRTLSLTPLKANETCYFSLHKYSRHRKSKIQAIPISSEVKEYLEKKNAAHYLKKQPQSLDEKNLRDYDVIVTMDQKVENVVLRRCPDCVVKIIEWDIRPIFRGTRHGKYFQRDRKQSEGIGWVIVMQ